MLCRMNADNEKVIMCTEPGCSGGGERPADGTVMGNVHTIAACQECADKHGAKLVPWKR